MAPLGEETPLIGNRSCSLSSMESGTLQVYLYHPASTLRSDPDLGGVLTFTYGEYLAEELCVAAAKACGERGGGAWGWGWDPPGAGEGRRWPRPP